MARISAGFCRKRSLVETGSPELPREKDREEERDEAKKDGRDFPEKDRIARNEWRVFRMPWADFLWVRKIERKLAEMLVAPLWLDSAGAEDDRIQPRGDEGIEGGRCLGLTENGSLESLDCSKRELSGERLIESDADRENFGPLADRGVGEPFRCEIAGGARA